MSIAKDIMAYDDVAKKILLDIGAIASCDAHDDYVYSTGMDNSKIYGRATSRLKTSEDYIGYSDFSLFHAAIDRVMNNVADTSECPWCKKAYEE